MLAAPLGCSEQRGAGAYAVQGEERRECASRSGQQVQVVVGVQQLGYAPGGVLGGVEQVGVRQETSGDGEGVDDAAPSDEAADLLGPSLICRTQRGREGAPGGVGVALVTGDRA